MVEIGAMIENELKEIASNEIIGSARVADLCAICLSHFAEESDAQTPVEFWNGLYVLCKKIVHIKPDMAPVFSLANSILTSVKEELDSGRSVEDLKKSLKAFADRSIRASKEVKGKISLFGSELIEEGDVILTHSYSSSVKEVFVKAHRSGKSFEVLVTESKPGAEGKVLVQELGREGIAASLINEDFTFQKVMVGADRISEDFFVNKVGTRGLALKAKKAGCDFFVVSGTNKFVTAKRNEEALFTNVIIANPYFEVIPLSLVSLIVCEEGLLPPAGVRTYLQEKIHFPDLLEPQ